MTPAKTADVCVIGAGSSGVAVAKCLRERGVAFEIFEKGSDIGGMWRYQNDNGMSCAYRSLHIDTSRRNLGYSDFPIPENKPDFLSHGEFLAYLEAYADRFGIRSQVRFKSEVKSVAKAADGQWNVTTADGTRSYRAVVVANGHLWDARWPSFPGTFSGTAIHAAQYRTAMPFEDKRVLVVGIGNSAVDIAVDLGKVAKSVVISTRTGAYIMPKYLMGIPVDRWARFFARKMRLPTVAVRMLMSKLIYFANGDQARFGIPRPKHPMWREHATLSQDLLPAVGHGRIRIKPNVAKLDGQAIEFADGTKEDFDAVIYATGYKTTFPFLAPEIFKVEDGQPVDLYRRIAPPNQPGLYFAGLIQPIGPTIPLVEYQARWIAGALVGAIKLPSSAEMAREVRDYHERKQRIYLNSARYTLEVDFNDYSRELSGDLMAR